VIGSFTLFASVLVILRWFKSDTHELMKVYFECTNKRLDALENPKKEADSK